MSRRLLLVMIAFVGFFPFFGVYGIDGMKDFLENIEPFNVDFYLKLSHDALMSALLSIKTCEDLLNFGEIIHIFSEHVSSQSLAFEPILGIANEKDPPDTKTICKAFSEGLLREFKIPQFYKVFYIIKDHLPGVDWPCPLQQPVDPMPEKYHDWETVFFAGMLDPNNYEALPPDMFKHLYGKLSHVRKQDSLDFFVRLMHKKATLAGESRASLLTFVTAELEALKPKLDEELEYVKAKQAALEADASPENVTRVKDYCLLSTPLLQQMFLYFSFPLKETTFSSSLVTTSCSKFAASLNDKFDDKKMLMFVRNYPKAVMWFFSPSITAAYRQPIDGTFQPTIMKAIISKSKYEEARYVPLYVKSATGSIHITVPYSFLDANLRAFTSYSSFSATHFLVRELIIYSKATDFSYLQDIFDSGYSRVIEAFIYNIIIRVPSAEVSSTDLEFKNLPKTSQFFLFWIVPNRYYSKWRMSDKYFDWIFRSMTPQIFFSLLDVLLDRYKVDPGLVGSYVDTLLNFMAFEHYAGFPSAIATLDSFDEWLAEKYPYDKLPWDQRQFAWQFKKVMSPCFEGRYIDYATFKACTSPQRQLEIFLNICDRTSADLYQKITRNDLIHIMLLFPFGTDVMSSDTDSEACNSLLNGSNALVSIELYCLSCFNELGTYILKDLLQPLILRLNQKNIILGSKVVLNTERLDRAFVETIYLKNLSKKALFFTVLSLILRANSFDYLLPYSPITDSASNTTAGQTVIASLVTLISFSILC